MLRPEDRHTGGNRRQLCLSEITDPAAEKTYSGAGKVSGNSLRMQGCVMKILCKSQTWTRL